MVNAGWGAALSFACLVGSAGARARENLMGVDEREPEMEPGEWAPPPPPMPVNTCDSQSLELTWEGEHWYNAGNAAPAVQCTEGCVLHAGFGPATTTALIDVPVVVAEPLTGCTALTNRRADTVGKLVLVKRGGCDYSTKVYRAQVAGAVAALVYESGSGGAAAMRPGANAADVAIPSLMIPNVNGEALRAAANAPGGTTITMDCYAGGYVVSATCSPISQRPGEGPCTDAPGCKDPSHCGTFLRTASSCDGVPAYQQPGGDRNVLFRTDDPAERGMPPGTRWNVGPPSRLADCGAGHGANPRTDYIRSAPKTYNGGALAGNPENELYTCEEYSGTTLLYRWYEVNDARNGWEFTAPRFRVVGIAAPPPPPPPPPCDSFTTFGVWSDALTDACCTVAHPCPGGVPSSCSPGCAAALIRMQAACADFERSIPTVQASLNEAAAMCRRSGH